MLAAGRTSDVYEYGSGNVVKVPRPDVPDHWALLEAEYTAAVRTLDVPAPSVIEVIQINGRNAIVLERIDGRSMWEHMVDEPGRIPELAATLASTQRAIFTAGLPAGLEGLVDRMSRKIDEVDRIPVDERRDAIQLLRSLRKGAALLHGDLHPGNVLMTERGPLVIDWFDASIGHPVSDIVRSSILMRPVGDRGDSPHLPGANPTMLAELHDSYIEAMSDLLVDEPAALRDWEALSALSRLSEGDQPDSQMLTALWRERADVRSSPLIEKINRMARRSAPGTPG